MSGTCGCSIHLTCMKSLLFYLHRKSIVKAVTDALIGLHKGIGLRPLCYLFHPPCSIWSTHTPWENMLLPIDFLKAFFSFLFRRLKMMGLRKGVMTV